MPTVECHFDSVTQKHCNTVTQQHFDAVTQFKLVTIIPWLFQFGCSLCYSQPSNRIWVLGFYSLYFTVWPFQFNPKFRLTAKDHLLLLKCISKMKIFNWQVGAVNFWCVLDTGEVSGIYASKKENVTDAISKWWVGYHKAVSCQLYSFISLVRFAKWICAIRYWVHCICKAREW